MEDFTKNKEKYLHGNFYPNKIKEVIGYLSKIDIHNINNHLSSLYRKNGKWKESNEISYDHLFYGTIQKCLSLLSDEIGGYPYPISGVFNKPSLGPYIRSFRNYYNNLGITKINTTGIIGSQEIEALYNALLLKKKKEEEKEKNNDYFSSISNQLHDVYNSIVTYFSPKKDEPKKEVIDDIKKEEIHKDNIYFSENKKINYIQAKDIIFSNFNISSTKKGSHEKGNSRKAGHTCISGFLGKTINGALRIKKYLEKNGIKNRLTITGGTEDGHTTSNHSRGKCIDFSIKDTAGKALVKLLGIKSNKKKTIKIGGQKMIFLLHKNLGASGNHLHVQF